jgi:hypothetical protein
MISLVKIKNKQIKQTDKIHCKMVVKNVRLCFIKPRPQLCTKILILTIVFDGYKSRITKHNLKTKL